MGVGWRRAVGAIVTLLLVCAAPARAHLGHDVARAERYVKLDVAGRDARLVVSLTLGAREGARLLRAADTDRSGDVSEAERDAHLAAWGEGLGAELPVRVDGEQLELRWGEPYMEPIGEVRATPTTVEMVARFELGGGQQSIHIEDRMVRREVYDRTDVAFRTRDGATLVASGVGDAPAEPTPELAYGPELSPGEPVVLTAVVETPARPMTWLWAALGGALLLAAATAALLRRKRKSPG